MKGIIKGKLFDRDNVEIICFFKTPYIIEELCKTKGGEYILAVYGLWEGVLIEKINYLRYLTLQDIMLWYEDIQNKGFFLEKEYNFFEEFKEKIEKI